MLTVQCFKKDNLKKDAKFKQLDEYLIDAKKQVIYFCKMMYPSYLARLSNDEEVISLIAYANMLADWRYDNTNLASRNTYANGYAKGFLKQIVRKLKKESRRGIPLDISEFYDLYDKKHEKHAENLQDKELIRVILGKMPPKTAKIVEDHYINGKTFEEIGKEYGLSKQAINQTVKRGLEKAKCENILS